MKEANREIESLRDQLRLAHVRASNGAPRRREARVPLIAQEVPAGNQNDLRGYADRYLEALGGSGVVAVANDSNFVIKVSRDLAREHPANELVAMLGQGGGKPELAQGRLTKPAVEAFNELEASLK